MQQAISAVPVQVPGNGTNIITGSERCSKPHEPDRPSSSNRNSKPLKCDRPSSSCRSESHEHVGARTRQLPESNKTDRRHFKAGRNKFSIAVFPPSMRTIIQNPLSLSSYTPLLQKLLHWIGRNSYRLLFAVATGQLILVAVVAVAPFILFFFMATSAAVVIILSGIVFVSASTASMATAIITCSICAGVVWKVAKKKCSVAKRLLSKAKSEVSALLADNYVNLPQR